MNPSITVVSLGPGDPELLNLKTVNTLKSSKNVVLRTEKHQAAGWLTHEGIAYTTLDRFYQSADDFDQLNHTIASFLWDQATVKNLVYAVSDPYTDRSVISLFIQKPENGVLKIVPGISAYDTNLSSGLAYLHVPDLRVVPACDLVSADFDPNCSLLVTELDDALLAGQIKIMLSARLNDDQPVIVLKDSALPQQIALYELDRFNDYDHLTAFLLPGTGFLQRDRFVLHDLVTIMDTLRAPDGCPWDRVQTHQSLCRYMIEEAWECVASVDQDDMDHFAEELGDLLFQIVFHTSIGSAFDEFTLDDVISLICAKMIRRHPHVFPQHGSSITTAMPDWESIKQSETGNRTALKSLDDVSPSMPSLKYAWKTIKKLDQLPAMRRTAGQVLDEITHIISFLNQTDVHYSESALSTLLYLCTELCYRSDMDGELLLHRITDHIKKRLREAEKLINSDGKSIEDLTLSELGVYLKHVEGETE